MIEDFHNDYVGPFDKVYRQALADYEDTIKELIDIEKGGNYFSPPKNANQTPFWEEIK